VHRDYKPENVLINGDGASKLTDFGIAARVGDAAIPAGTLVYAPPEQFGGTPISPASDVYAATVTFYECLTGTPPFRGDTAEALLYQHMAAPIPLEPVPEPLRPLVAAGMAKEPERRPTDGTTLVAALQAAAVGAYGPDWEKRGRSHLGEAALLLAALWPIGKPPAAEGFTVERLPLFRRVNAVRAAAVAVAVVLVAGAGTAFAVTGTHKVPISTPTHPAAEVQHISLQPLTSSPTSSSPLASPSPTPSLTASSIPPPVYTPPPTTPSPSKSVKPKPSKSPSKSPSPTPSASPTPTPTPPPTPTPTLPTPTPTPSQTRGRG
jgi:serine/threonine protein kinase